jgi:hypothetical protein
MSTQEIIRELTKLNRDELAQVDLKLHELLEEKIRTVVGHSKCTTEDRNRRLENVPPLMGGNGSISSVGGRLELGHVQRPQSESSRSNPRFTSEGME